MVPGIVVVDVVAWVARFISTAAAAPLAELPARGFFPPPGTSAREFSISPSARKAD